MTDGQENSYSSSLGGLHAIVTGGGRGLGVTLAASLARAGASVTIMGRDPTHLAETTTHLMKRGGVTVRSVVCDVSEPESIAVAFAAATDVLGPADILVNNAGQARSAPFTETSLEMWRRPLAVTLPGAFLCSQQVLPYMVGIRRGRIVNVASTAALRGYATLAAYCASKHGLLGLTRSLAAEVAQFEVTVNAVCPGYTEGGMSDQAVQAIMALQKVSAEDALAKLVRHSPRRRLTTQDEVAATVTWLCSTDAAAVTGQAIAVAGGEIM